MITKKDLDDRHEKLIEYVRSGKSNFGSEPTRMFCDDGTFNRENWNGGDDLIRDYISKIRDDSEKDLSYAELEFGDYEYDLIINCNYLQDHTYVSFVINTWEKKKPDIALIRIYKRRGCTELAIYNSELMNLEQYLFLLNLIERTGFKFSK